MAASRRHVPRQPNYPLAEGIGKAPPNHLPPCRNQAELRIVEAYLGCCSAGKGRSRCPTRLDLATAAGTGQAALLQQRRLLLVPCWRPSLEPKGIEAIHQAKQRFHGQHAHHDVILYLAHHLGLDTSVLGCFSLGRLRPRRSCHQASHPRCTGTPRCTCCPSIDHQEHAEQAQHLHGRASAQQPDLMVDRWIASTSSRHLDHP